MISIMITLSRFTLILTIALYTYHCFCALQSNISPRREERLYARQRGLLHLFLLQSNFILFIVTKDIRILVLYGGEVLLCIITLFIYRYIYRHASESLVTNMCMLLSIGLVSLSRLNLEQAVKQFIVAACAVGATCIIPIIVAKLKGLNKLTWLYGIIGIGGLAVVAVAATTEYGAKLSLSIGPVSIQPSEFIKIIFVFFVAGMLYESTEFKHVVKTTIIAALHVLILVASRDLGGAFIFLITYLVMLYVATRQPWYLFLGFGSGALAAVVAYFLFSHVQARVIAWKDPLSVINNEGYQVSQSLFAIGSGGWFGTGIGQGMPNKIPVVTKDFIFSAISEEFGAAFGLCLIFIIISCFLMFFNISMQMRDQFYKLIALGLGTEFGIQVFLALGGVIKFIPATGVTLPLVSYGGSSLLSTMVLFAIIQGLYVLQVEQGVKREKKKNKKES